MSIQANNMVWERSLARGRARLVLLAIADHADADGRAWPSFARLAERCRMHRSGVTRSVRHLIEIGELVVAGKGSRGGNVYQITLGTDTATVTATIPVEPDLTGTKLRPTGTKLRPDWCRSGTRNRKEPSGTTNARDGAHLEPFQFFWRTYPSRRPHSNPRKTALKSFKAALTRGITADDINRGAEHFAEHIRREGGDPKFIPMAATWLNQERWTEHQEAPPPETREIGPF